MRVAVSFAVLLAASPALAEGLAPHQSIQEHAPASDRTFAVAVNEPFGWGGFAIAGSVYGRVAAHQAVRINAAAYDFHGNVAGDLIDIFAFGGDGDESYRKGRIVDVGAGWVYFPRRVFDGPTVELGLLHRSSDTHVEDEWDTPEVVDRKGKEVAARALLGWSWMIQDRVFISWAMGASKGYSFGTETTKEMAYTGSGQPSPSMTHHYGEWTTSFEGYLRFGVAF